MKDVFYCKGVGLANYLMKNGSKLVETKFENGKFVFVFKNDESITENMKKWELDERKWLF